MKETIQTRNRKSTGKSKKKGKKILSSHLTLTPPLSSGEGTGVFSGQGQISPRSNYVLATASGSYEQPSPPIPIRYGEYNYAPIGFTPAGYNIIHSHQGYNNDKQERDGYVCEAPYSSVEDVKPNIGSTTSAFNVISAPPQYAMNSSHSVSRAEEQVDTTMTASGTFHASTYSAFSPFTSDQTSPLGQSPTQATQSPLL